ncbi:HD domain-containing phosphohydrolase [Undibacterium cyanobacteriorum]|uniref:HD domain-containing phosphohydrolase n=1 Tax=Undibacterium cyanobacteriorum TaxID=3073561 RepID=A0ABY9RHK3_9BURK|nr:HD domain-containing phosphohydrolase [Undibacterium sp. 20NA77.5]WMW80706.1 HD domain-containing phosphohydrolase [Undibacterium sp. 20NA77.5]
MSELNPEQIAQRLQHLTELSVELNGIKDVNALLERILQTAKSLTGADGGTLYRLSEDKRQLRFDMAINDTLGMHFGGSHPQASTIPPIPLYTEHGSQNLNAVVAFAANLKQSVNIEHVYQTPLFNFSGMRKFDEDNNYHCQSLLTVPMLDHESELIGVLQLINKLDPDTKQILPFSRTDQGFIEALASQAAIAMSTQELIFQLENLFESLVNLINIGIDEKSPNTGRHCQHVPELTMMLAEAAHRHQEGELKEFRMSDKDRRELWLAGLLHDCGKITTPVHVIEKSTKLETIFDRIHLIDTRFEILRRDLEIAFLREGDHSEPRQQRYQQDLAKLDAERAFLRHANVGGERMSDDDQARVRQIAQRTWTDSHGSAQHLLNTEETENLTIKAGTLTAEERKIINNHISVTIRMLEALPWPKHLKNVPEYAGGHHERMDGKGYPRGLTREQMSVQARIMAIADIFEALSARDRPYKTGKTLTESLNILGNFSLNGHIDPELFHVFVKEKVYLEYAKKFMDPSQIDQVDESKIPGYLRTTSAP